jgi:hypothetical protein
MFGRGELIMSYDVSVREFNATNDDGVGTTIHGLNVRYHEADAPAGDPTIPPTLSSDGAIDTDPAGPAAGDIVMAFLAITERTRGESADQLMTKVLNKSRAITRAEAGSIFILRAGREGGHILQPACMQNDVIRIDAAKFMVPVNADSIAGYVAKTGDTLVIDDLYGMPPDLPYSFDSRFDDASGYRSRSMICFPITNFDGALIGVVQLINRRGTARIDAMPFTAAEATLFRPVTQILGAAIERAGADDRAYGRGQHQSAPAQRRTSEPKRNPGGASGNHKRRFSFFGPDVGGVARSMTRTPQAITAGPISTASSWHANWV